MTKSSSALIYLDHHATTPCDPRVLAAMLPWFTECFGNPASTLHVAGRQALEAVENARCQVAALIGAEAREILFLGGATESDNLAILGLARAYTGSRRRIVTSVIEHKAVLEPCRVLEADGFEIIRLPVDRSGKVSLSAAREAITENTFLISIQAANNETGVLQPVQEIAALARGVGAAMHCDAAQCVGKLEVDVDELDVDLLSFSAHKLYGPKGVGALFLRGGSGSWKLEPLIYGGGQERGLRSGTHNVPAIVGFGEACRVAAEDLLTESVRISALRDLLEARLLEAAPELKRNGAGILRLPGSSSLTFPGTDSEALIMNCPGLALSNGAACSSGAPEPSPVLMAMGLSREEAWSTIRIGVGRFNTTKEIEEAAGQIIAGYRRVSSSSRR